MSLSFAFIISGIANSASRNICFYLLYITWYCVILVNKETFEGLSQETPTALGDFCYYSNSTKIIKIMYYGLNKKHFSVLQHISLI